MCLREGGRGVEVGNRPVAIMDIPPSPIPPNMSRMAASNLQIDESIRTSWASLLSHTGEGIPLLSFTINAEKISLGSPLATIPTPSDLWAYLSSQATLALTPPTPPPTPGAKPSILPPRPEPRLWLTRAGRSLLFISFTPEGVHPRQKMLYASARDDLRRDLPASAEHLGADYHTSEVSELTAGAFEGWSRRDKSEAMSSREKEAAEVVRSINQERASMTMPMRAVGGMQRVPYTLDGALGEALGGFKAGAAAPGVRWLEIKVKEEGGVYGEVLQLASSGSQAGVVELTGIAFGASAAEPRFFLTMPDTSAAAAAAATAGGGGGEGEASSSTPANPAFPVLLVYHCPEMAKPKARMIYSTAKTALTEALTGAGVVVAKVSETRDQDDVSTAFSEFAASPFSKRVSGVAVAEASVSTAQAEAAAAEAGEGVKSPAARFGGRALPGMPGASPGMFKLPGMGPK